MYQIEWFDQKMKCESPVFNYPLIKEEMMDKDKISHVRLLYWEERCLECAAPHCYNYCANYLARKDRKCRNLYYGIHRNTDCNSLYGYGAELRFRRWGMIKTLIYPGVIALQEIIKYDRINRAAVYGVNFFADIIQPINKKRRLNGALGVYRRKLFSYIKSKFDIKMDEFIFQCISCEDESFKMIFEILKNSKYIYKTSFDLKKGINFYNIPIRDMGVESELVGSSLRIFPENNKEAQVILLWCDFVRYNEEFWLSKIRPANKIKCVAWDLDNTMWDCILIESQAEEIRIRPEVIELIKNLDARGILQSITSKNNFDEAWEVLKANNISEYFLYPMVNWHPKSQNLKHIAKKLNINVDTFAFIDDSEFERNEVLSSLPNVRVYNEKDVLHILNLPEFDVPITKESYERRKMYKMEEERNEIFASYDGKYENFLINSHISIKLFKPINDETITRCYELVQRTNQLNLSGIKYSSDVFKDMLKNPKFKCIAFECEDKFGSYGIVCFLSLLKHEKDILIKEFAMSCRIVNKYVESAFIKWLLNQASKEGFNNIQAHWTKTEKNSLLLDVLLKIGFQKTMEDEKSCILVLSVDSFPANSDIVSVYSTISIGEEDNSNEINNTF